MRLVVFAQRHLGLDDLRHTTDVFCVETNGPVCCSQAGPRGADSQPATRRLPALGGLTDLPSAAKDDHDEFGATLYVVQNEQPRDVVLHAAFANP